MEEDEEEEATVSLAAAEETSVDAAVAADLLELSIQVVLFFPLRFLGTIYWPRRQSLMWPWQEKTPFDLQVKSGQLMLNDHTETGFSSGQPE